MTENCCYGIKSNTTDNKHIVMVDADIPKNTSLELYVPEVYSTLKYMQFEYFLSDFYVIKTKNGFNAFTLDKLELELLTSMLWNYEIIDQLFIYFNNKRGYYTLRWGKDKTFLNIIKSPYNIHKKSYAHAKFFKDIIGIPIKLDKKIEKLNYDTSHIFEIIKY